MPTDQSLVVEPALLAAVMVALVGLAAYWANPRRIINRVFLSVSLNVSAWLTCLYFALTEVPGLPWFRWTCFVGAFLPIHVWLLRESVIGTFAQLGVVARKAFPWAMVSLIMAVLAPSEWFVPVHSTAENPVYGWGFYLYWILHFGINAALCADTVRKLKSQVGVARIELQILLIGGSATAIAVLLLMAIGVVFRTKSAIHLQPLVVLAFYTLTVLAITTHRIFDARHLLRLFMQRVALVTLVAGAAFGVDILFQLFLPEPLAFLATTAVVLAFAVELNTWLDGFTGRFPRAVQARGAIISMSRNQDPISELIVRFSTILSGWGSTERSFIWVREESRDLVKQSDIDLGEPCWEALRDVRWVTPERIARERSTPRSQFLRSMLDSERLGALVFTKGATLDVMIGMGMRTSRRPFTFPEVVQLQELGSMIESSLARSHLAAKAQQAERLAAVGLLGASVAHEIRNPLVSIKTFVQLFPIHYMDESFRVRFSRLIGSEVARIERLTEQLLDLASPRKYEPDPVSLHDVVKNSLELVYSKAEDKKTEIVVELAAVPDIAFTDANATKQVILNLCFNAIQAQESQERERWVRLTTRNVDQGIELIVSDHGPGIAPEIRSRLFEAFQTTKSSGFGLGLAICSEILSSLGASISVDPFAPGQGATFRVVFPCPPRSS